VSQRARASASKFEANEVAGANQRRARERCSRNSKVHVVGGVRATERRRQIVSRYCRYSQAYHNQDVRTCDVPLVTGGHDVRVRRCPRGVPPIAEEDGLDIRQLELNKLAIQIEAQKLVRREQGDVRAYAVSQVRSAQSENGTRVDAENCNSRGLVVRYHVNVSYTTVRVGDVEFNEPQPRISNRDKKPVPSVLQKSPLPRGDYKLPRVHMFDSNRYKNRRDVLGVHGTRK